MKLYTYFRSSAAFRVRIALALKGVAVEHIPIHLRRGDQVARDYAAVNPQRFVPALDTGTTVLTQSLAIIEYLDETVPRPPLLPPGPEGRARVKALAQIIACDIHPINNLKVMMYLRDVLKVADADATAWSRHWIGEGFTALERLLAESPETGRFCHGDSPGLADICLVPQVYNAGRVGCPLDAYPTIRRINAACLELEAFSGAWPDRQPDADL
ncbi:MAG: maleylacetoacetate isomerase [Rhodospirillaceae bacterium]|nr:maleylacetoacetate isomerase [Rhodospirillaceae bacterium]